MDRRCCQPDGELLSALLNCCVACEKSTSVARQICTTARDVFSFITRKRSAEPGDVASLVIALCKQGFFKEAMDNLRTRVNLGSALVPAVEGLLTASSKHDPSLHKLAKVFSSAFDPRWHPLDLLLG
jgi:hypothetical protein